MYTKRIVGLLCLSALFFLHDTVSYYYNLALQKLDPQGDKALSLVPDWQVVAGAACLVAAVVMLLWPRIRRWWASDFTETFVVLQVIAGQPVPLQSKQVNSWSWYTLPIIADGFGTDGKPLARHHFMTILVWIFEKPTTYSQVEVIGKNMALPVYEVRERSTRHAIIIFEGNLPPGTLELRLRQVE